MRNLITGATGLLGANLAHTLAAAGERPRLLVRETSDRRCIRGLGLEEALGDVTDPASLPAAMKGVTHVYHLAGIVRFDPAHRAALNRVHIEGTRNVLQAARAAGVKRVVHVSTIAAVGHGSLEAPATEATAYNFEGSNPYHESKRAGEDLALSYNADGFEVVVANPTYLIGPYDVKPSSGNVLLFVAKGWVKAFPTGGNNFANADDVARGLVLCMKKGRPGERYILGGENLTYRQALTLAAEEAGVPPPRLPAPERLLRLAGRFGDLFGRVSPDLFEQVNTPLVQSLFLSAYASSRKAETELGYRITPFRRGVRAALSWFQEEGYLPRDHGLTPQGTLSPP